MFTSDLMNDQVHLAVGAFAQLSDNFIVLVNLEFLQVLSGEELQLLQDVDRHPRHDRRGAHFSTGAGVESESAGNSLTLL